MTRARAEPPPTRRAERLSEPRRLRRSSVGQPSESCFRLSSRRSSCRAEAGVGPGEIKDRETLKAWLDSQPRQVVDLIAARAALRTLPLFSRAVRALDFGEVVSRKKAPRRFADLTVALFRAAALARVAGTYPTRANELQ